MTIWLNAGGGALTSRVDGPLAAVTRAMALVDINGNGRPEVVTVNSQNYIDIDEDLTRYGSGGVSAYGAYGSDPRGVAVADVNGDGTPDLLIANRGSGTLVVELAFPLSSTASPNTQPGFQPGVAVRVGNGSRAIAVADFNTDGRPDIATGDETAKTVSILTNTNVFAGRP